MWNISAAVLNRRNQTGSVAMLTSAKVIAMPHFGEAELANIDVQ